MGTVGGIFVLILGMVFKTSSDENVYMEYTGYIIAVCAIMAIGLAIFIFTVKEKPWNEEMLLEQKEIDKNSVSEESENENTTESKKLSKDKFISLILILISVALWYTGYNAVTTKYSLYATTVLNQNYNLTLIIAQAAAIVSFIPVGMLAGKIGRKKSILIGVAMLFVAFATAAFITANTPPWFMYIIFSLAGIAWATINVNSFPMVVELATGSNIGKYTGYYYTASMAAQVITPILSGAIMDIFNGSMRTLFPYAAFFVAGSFVTMYFVKHGDVQKLGKKTVKEYMEESLSMDD